MVPEATLPVSMANTLDLVPIRSISPRPRILVVGLGNALLQDDGVGVHAVREFRKAGIRGVVAADVGTAVLGALQLFEWADRILAIDAIQAGGKPGTVYLYGASDEEERGFSPSLHEVYLHAALKLLSRKKTQEAMVLGIEPETIGYGPELTPTLRSVLPKVIREARSIVSQWREDEVSTLSGRPWNEGIFIPSEFAIQS